MIKRENDPVDDFNRIVFVEWLKSEVDAGNIKNIDKANKIIKSGGKDINFKEWGCFDQKRT